MSKVKDQMEKDHEREMEQYYSFMEFVCDQKVSKNDGTDEVEEDSLKSSTTRTSIVPTNTLKAVNNPNYNPNRSIK